MHWDWSNCFGKHWNMLGKEHTNGRLLGVYGRCSFMHLVHVLYYLVLQATHMLSHTCLARKLQDPAGFLYWFHRALRMQRPDIICRPSPEGPEALANVQEDLLQALRLNAERPRALAIFVDEAGYMVSVCSIVIVVAHLFGDLWMPRDGLMLASLYIPCASTHITLCTCAGSCPCQQARKAASKRGSQLFPGAHTRGVSR